MIVSSAMAKLASKGSYEDLIVWQKGMDLVDAVMELAEQYPKEHVYGLASQTRNSAISIPSNIAEGRRRGYKAEFKRFLTIAYGSGAELETQIKIAKRQPFGRELDFSRIDSLLSEVMKMLNVMLRK